MQFYDPALGKNSYCIISGALLYDHPYTGRTYRIVIQQAVEIPDLKDHILFLMQVCTNSVTVNDCPRFMTDHSTEETHAIIDDDEWGYKVILPLCLSGVASYLHVRLLAGNEWNQRETPRITLTNKHSPG